MRRALGLGLSCVLALACGKQRVDSAREVSPAEAGSGSGFHAVVEERCGQVKPPPLAPVSQNGSVQEILKVLFGSP